MNLSQLLQLRTNIKQSDNKVISRDTFLAVLDSHISALGGQDDSSIIRLAETPQEGVQRAYETPIRSTIRVPPTKEHVNRAYNA